MRRFHFEMRPKEARSKGRQPISLTQRGATYFEMSGPAEFVAAAVLCALMLGIRVVHTLRHGFDNDESQHLHVIWGWARGFVQYRDLFDNHMPLFFVAAWCTYQIGTSLFSRRAGVWAVVLVGLYTGYHFISLEFRTDNLWAPLWLLCIAVLVSRPLTARRALAAGLLLGLCFGVSMKSVLFLYSIAFAALATLSLVGRQRLGQSWSYLAQ